MSIDVFGGWSKERVVAILDMWPGCAMNASKKGDRKGDHLKYGASYVFTGPPKRAIVVNLRGERRGVEVAINASSVAGRPFKEEDFPSVLLLRRLLRGFEGQDGNPGIRTSVNRNASLKPTDNEVLELYVRDEASFLGLMEWYSDSRPPSLKVDDGTEVPRVEAQALVPDPTGVVASTGSQEGLSPEALHAQNAANAETGRIGELIAMDAERLRLQGIGCLDVDEAIVHVALQRVDAGFDIESNWNGERRCIEVKSSTTEGCDFFLSVGERNKLVDLGLTAWLYRVIVRPDGASEVVEMLRDPMAHIPESCFQPVSWRIRMVSA